MTCWQFQELFMAEQWARYPQLTANTFTKLTSQHSIGPLRPFPNTNILWRTTCRKIKRRTNVVSLRYKKVTWKIQFHQDRLGENVLSKCLLSKMEIHFHFGRLSSKNKNSLDNSISNFMKILGRGPDSEFQQGEKKSRRRRRRRANPSRRRGQSRIAPIFPKTSTDNEKGKNVHQTHIN